jgi:hypothetical protein
MKSPTETTNFGFLDEKACVTWLSCRLAMTALYFLVLLAYLIAGESDASFPVNYYGVDVSQLTSEASFRCLVQNNLLFAVIRCYESVGRPDPNCAASVMNAHRGGVKVCRAMDCVVVLDLFISFELRWRKSIFIHFGC